MTNNEKQKPLKPCHFGCNWPAKEKDGMVEHQCGVLHAIISVEKSIWNNRPEEDRLNAEITRLKAENEQRSFDWDCQQDDIERLKVENERLTDELVTSNNHAMRLDVELQEKNTPHPPCETCDYKDDWGGVECALRKECRECTDEELSYCSIHSDFDKKEESTS